MSISPSSRLCHPSHSCHSASTLMCLFLSYHLNPLFFPSTFSHSLTLLVYSPPHSIYPHAFVHLTIHLCILSPLNSFSPSYPYRTHSHSLMHSPSHLCTSPPLLPPQPHSLIPSHPHPLSHASSTPTVHPALRPQQCYTVCPFLLFMLQRLTVE